jgi:hypothetical protein
MLAYVKLVQSREKELGCDVLTHQKWSGASYIDGILGHIQSGSSGSKSMGEGNTETGMLTLTQTTPSTCADYLQASKYIACNRYHHLIQHELRTPRTYADYDGSAPNGWTACDSLTESKSDLASCCSAARPYDCFAAPHIPQRYAPPVLSTSTPVYLKDGKLITFRV